MNPRTRGTLTGTLLLGAPMVAGIRIGKGEDAARKEQVEKAWKITV
jgi:hypothetical protein